MVRSLRAFMKLCININADTGFQFDSDMVIPDSDLLDPVSHQGFVKFGEVGSLLCDIILQVSGTTVRRNLYLMSATSLSSCRERYILLCCHFSTGKLSAQTAEVINIGNE